VFLDFTRIIFTCIDHAHFAQTTLRFDEELARARVNFQGPGVVNYRISKLWCKFPMFSGIGCI